MTRSRFRLRLLKILNSTRMNTDVTDLHRTPEVDPKGFENPLGLVTGSAEVQSLVRPLWITSRYAQGGERKETRHVALPRDAEADGSAVASWVRQSRRAVRCGCVGVWGCGSNVINLSNYPSCHCERSEAIS